MLDKTMNHHLPSRRMLWLALLVLIIYTAAFQGMRGLWDSSEGRYTNVAVEMLRFNDWLHPVTHHEHPHWTKPPLTYWALAASMSGLGHSEWAVRMPGALAFLLTVLLVYLLGRLFVPERPWLPALIYTSFVLPATASNVITTDNLLTLAETAAITGFAYAYWAEGGSFGARYGALLGWLAGGVGFLIKGPAVGLPLFALLIFHGLRRRQLVGRRLYWLLGPLLAAALGISWFMALSDNKPALLIDFIWNEVIMRATTGEHHRNSSWYGGLVIYLPVLLIGSLPWTWIALRGVAGTLRRWWQSHRDAGVVMDDRDRLLLLWLLVPLAVFMVARSRLPLYVLPLFVPLALLAARAAGQLVQRRLWVLLPALGMVAVLALRVTAGVMVDHRDSRALAQQLVILADGPIGEVVFVDQEAQQGLSFYIDAEVEELRMDSRSSEPGAPTEGVDQEPLEEEPDRLWLMVEGAAPHFEAWAGGRGMHARRLGSVDGLHPYLVYRLDPVGG